MKFAHWLFFLLCWTGVAQAQRAMPALCEGRIAQDQFDVHEKSQPGVERRCYEDGLDLLDEATGSDTALSRAFAIFQTLIRRNPKNVLALTGEAEALMRARELGVPYQQFGSVWAIRDRAVHAVRLEPRSTEAQITLGRAELLTGCPGCARRAAIEAERLGKPSSDLYVLQSRIAEAVGDHSAAVSHLRAAIGFPGLRKQKSSRLRLELAGLLTRRGQLNEADKELLAAIQEAPANPMARLRRAEWLLYRRGDAPAALQVLNDANAIGPTLASRRAKSLADYLGVSRDYLGGKPVADLQRIIQTAFISPEEAFILAAQHKPLSPVCEALLKSGNMRNLEARDGEGMTALIGAAGGGNVEVMRQLLGRKANTNARTSDGVRALSMAILAGNREALKLLLEAGAEVNYADEDGRTPLLLAVQRRDAGMVVDLLNKKAKLLPGNPWTAGDLLALSAVSDDVSTAKALLDSGIPAGARNRAGTPVIVEAVYWRSKGMIRLLLERGADSKTAAEAAQGTGDPDIVEFVRKLVRTPV